jgi:hypothetical protein
MPPELVFFGGFYIVYVAGMAFMSWRRGRPVLPRYERREPV